MPSNDINTPFLQLLQVTFPDSIDHKLVYFIQIIITFSSAAHVVLDGNSSSTRPALEPRIWSLGLDNFPETQCAKKP